MVSGAPGPVLGRRRHDRRGRVGPRPLPSRPLRARPADRSGAQPADRERPRRNRPLVRCHQPRARRVVAGTIAVLGTLGTRAMEVMTLDDRSRRTPALEDALDPRVGLAASVPAARDAARRGARRRRPDRDLDRLARRKRRRAARRRSSTSTAARSAPGRRRRTSRSILLVAARLSRRPAEHPRLRVVRPRLDPAAARRLGRRRRRRRPCRARPRDRARARGPGSARRARACSYGGFMVNWLVGTIGPVPGGRLGERRDQPGLRLGQLRLGPRVRPRVAARRPVQRRGHRQALAPVAAAQRRRRSARRC